MFDRLREDIKTVINEDPAARGIPEVIFCYPGLHALWAYRVAHILWRRRFFLPARFLSQVARFFTGIEIHPGAIIGRRFFIDHGSGVVIGETSVIGDDVLIYQGVVLGGTSLKKAKRHPTIGNKVVIGTGAVVLGAIIIGDGARVGAGSVVVKPVPPDATVVGVPGKIIPDRHISVPPLEHARLPDPVNDSLKLLIERQNEMQRRLEMLEKQSSSAPAGAETRLA